MPTGRWTDDDELRLVMMLGLRKGLTLVGGARRSFNEDEQKRIARVIIGRPRTIPTSYFSGGKIS
jgi:hypothetical protein